jgi:molybdopterin biosynthesis enzyme
MTQTIARLTPLADVQALIAAEVKPVAPCALDLAAAAGCVLAADVVAPSRPAAAITLTDGWALRSEDTLGAGGYAPALLTTVPVRIDAGQTMPSGCDCVAPVDAVRVSGLQAEALAEIAPGEGVLPAGGDHDGATPLARAGKRLTQVQAAALAALGIINVQVRRPRVLIACVRNDPILAACANLMAADTQRRGGIVNSAVGVDASPATEDVDAVAVIGGTGTGRNDTSAASIARAGTLAVHGIALAPGETAGFGFVNKRPVLLLPGRLDAALSVWMMLGRALLDRLSGAAASAQVPQTLTLARKVTSTVGLTELIPVRRNGAQAEPLASRFWALSATARADGYIVISPESEGASAGSAVEVWPSI